MTTQGLDYAGGIIGGGTVVASGYAFVCRYLSDGGSSLPNKKLTPNEAADLQANGVGIVSNWETTADMMLGGYDQGVIDAQRAWAQHKVCGGPDARPIYFSADFDATPAQQAQIDDYLRGAASVIGATNVGIYGGYWPVSRALTNGTAAWAWQTQAWSGGNQDARINLLQNNNAGYAYVGGVQCDVNQALTADFGQWNAVVPTTPPVTPPVTPPTGEPPVSNPNANASPQSVADSLDGILDGKPLDYRIVDMLRVRVLGDVASNTDPNAPGTAGPNAEGPNRSTSVFDQVKTLADVLTGRWEINGKYYDTAELIYLIAVKLGVGS